MHEGCVPTSRPPQPPSLPPLHNPASTHPHPAPQPPSTAALGRGFSESEGFVLHHFAGDVCYSSAGFMHANTEKLSPELEVKSYLTSPNPNPHPHPHPQPHPKTKPKPKTNPKPPP
jgi:hypothetical protein